MSLTGNKRVMSTRSSSRSATPLAGAAGAGDAGLETILPPQPIATPTVAAPSVAAPAAAPSVAVAAPISGPMMGSAASAVAPQLTGRESLSAAPAAALIHPQPQPQSVLLHGAAPASVTVPTAEERTRRNVQWMSLDTEEP